MPTRDEYVETIKHAFLTMGDDLVMAYILVKMPWMSTPFLKQICQFFVNAVLTIAVNKTEMGAFFLFIDFRTSAQGRDFYDKAVVNRDVQTNPKSTPEEKERAKQDAIDNFRALVKFSA
jgi:hypothetical protein